MTAPTEGWRPDGWDVRARLGVLTPHADVGPESELRAMAPAGIGLHTARVPFGAMRQGGTMDPTIPLAPVRDFAAPPHVDEAAAQLAAAPLAAIAYAFTSSAYVIGARGEAAMIARLSARANGLPVVATCAATVDALHAADATRLCLVDPPWFDPALNDLGRAYYEAAGFDVRFSAPCALPSGQSLIRPGDLHDWAAGHVPDDAEAVVIGGNGLRAVGVIEALETTSGRPVFTANQVLLWSAMNAAGTHTDDVTGYGRLFALSPR
ncbi:MULTISPECIES: maleate cis-trans isomerase [unclassified Streptomyces]|uniref:maleate cis-trans isomerase family protein n=1 Tax=unclassified Streptomyces TaxID=2593676 RepID=UPI000DC795D5|nr:MULTISPECIES: maleate cis-trans isomerase [unclassified Streptomyces]AWZ05993.1 maleate cis-trans isomerase [Streptomyces sp. ICC4]AWZ13545.1 maleate cis-trans isomerase [Streptomyces sp. ICC1]